ncbi:MAG: NAD-dependent epimerase/dehydratase family protein, partial [Planctomycetota bacterium]
VLARGSTSRQRNPTGRPHPVHGRATLCQVRCNDPGPWACNATHVGDLADRAFVERSLEGVQAVLHAATLHKPQIGTCSKQRFVDTNVTGTLNLLEGAVAAGADRFVFTSTTSAFGEALVPPPHAPAAWITEDVAPVVKNIYGATKTAAEDLCRLAHLERGLPCLILRTSRFFPERDDLPDRREAFADENLKVNELLHRRVDLEDVVDAHLLALERAPRLGFARYVISATTPFTPDDLAELRLDATAVIARRVPEAEEVYARQCWRLPREIERVYVNARAREELGWRPRRDFAFALARLAAGEDWRSELSLTVGSKGYPSAGAAYAPTPGPD